MLQVTLKVIIKILKAPHWTAFHLSVVSIFKTKLASRIYFFPALSVGYKYLVRIVIGCLYRVCPL